MTDVKKSRCPHIVLILADNLGWGELGCYGGGILRGAPTPRIDRLAAEGLRLLNFNVESDCVPTRSALMTGRHPIRTGAIQSVPAGLPQGIHLGIAGDTIMILASDNGPEFRRPWRGTAGPWTGTYHTAMEGGLRAPFIIRWPGQVPSGRVSNEIVHVTDLYATLARIGGALLPTDRPIDGADQLDFFLGKQEKSSREGFVFYIKNELRAVKWRNWKMHLVRVRVAEK